MGTIDDKFKTEHEDGRLTRQKIYEFTWENPGASISEMAKEIGMNKGATFYHLRRLEGAGLVRHSVDGLRRRYYEISYIGNVTKISATQLYILELVKGNSITSQREIARTLRKSQQTVNYNIKALEKKGFIEREKNGRSYKYKVL